MSNVSFGVRANIAGASGVFGILGESTYDKNWSGTTVTFNSLPQGQTVAIEFPSVVGAYEFLRIETETGAILSWTRTAWGAQATLTGQAVVLVRYVLRHHVSVAIGSGSGYVDGVGDYYQGESVTLTAHASSGYKFKDFYREGVRHVNPYTFTMPASDVTVTVYFEDDFVSFKVTSDHPDVATVSSSPPAGGQFVKERTVQVRRGSQVTLTALDPLPYTGLRFTNWNGLYNSNPYTFNATADYRVYTANYAAVSQTIHVRSGVGGTTTPSAGTYTQTTIEPFTITAIDEQGYEFKRWKIEDGSEPAYYVTSRTYTTTYSSQSVDITPEFEKIKCKIIVQPDDGDHGETTPSGTVLYDYGDRFRAQAYNTVQGWVFDHWYTNAVTPLEDPTNAVIDIEHLVLGNEGTYTAVYIKTSEIKYTLTLGVDPSYPDGYVTDNFGHTFITPTGEEYVENTIVNLHAQPDEGYKFGFWVDTQMDNPNPRSIVADRSKTVLAAFIPVDSFTVTVNASPPEGGTITVTPSAASYPRDTHVVIEASANEGYRFKRWSDGSKKPIRDFYMRTNIELTAYFDTYTPISTPILGVIYAIIKKKKGGKHYVQL